MSVGLLVRILLVLAFPFGILFLIRGLVGKRVGTEPRCGKCGYNLTGLPSEICPECGFHVQHEDIVHGVRQRHRYSLVLGLVLLTASTAALAGALCAKARQISYYHYFPFSVVLSDALRGDHHAIWELQRRSQDGSLKGPQCNRVVDTALDRQANAPVSDTLQAWIDFLHKRDVVGGLSPEQQNRYYEQSVQWSLELRSQVRCGDPIPARLTGKMRCPAEIPLYHYQFQPVAAVDGRRLQLEGVHAGFSEDYFTYRMSGERVKDAPGAWVPLLKGCRTSYVATMAVPSDALNPGPHTFEYRARWVQRRDNPAGPRAPGRYWSRPLALSAEFELLPADAPDYLELIDEPLQRALIRGGIKVKEAEVRFRPRLWPTPALYYLRLAFEQNRDLPFDVAFDVVVRHGVREITCGSIWCPEGRQRYHRLETGGYVPRIDGESIDIVLRSSADVARRTVDLRRLWDGQIELSGIPLGR
ncbi:MAG: hypothetical protein JSU68_08870 [Phycisphaerales bacterium]|nr:MAG: hypothetical protein JSU68_08870 [Phycisphaerales bacterium]